MVWFMPIMFGQAVTSKAMHIHLIILDSVTHLPLVVTIIVSQEYTLHWFIFVDVAYKLVLLLRAYGYHGFYQLIVNRDEVNAQDKEEQKAMEQQNEAVDDDDPKKNSNASFKE